MNASAPPPPSAPLPRSIDPSLDRSRAEAAVIERLESLGQPPDMLDAGAMGALIRHAAGSAMRLRAGLTACLFLASTENAGQVDEDMVYRALYPGQPRPAAAMKPPQPPPLAPRVDTAPPSWSTPVKLGVAAATAAVALTVLFLRPSHHTGSDTAPQTLAVVTPQASRPATPSRTDQASTPAVTPPPPDQGPRPATPAPTVPSSDKPASEPPAQDVPPEVPVVQAPAAPSAPALPPASAQAQLPAPREAPGQGREPTPGPARDVLPANPPTSVTLLFPASDRQALNRLKTLAEHLQHVGIKAIHARPDRSPPARRAVTFFYNSDLAAAQKVAKALADTGFRDPGGNSLQPSLVVVPQGLPPRSPGTVEVQLP